MSTFRARTLTVIVGRTVVTCPHCLRSTSIHDAGPFLLAHIPCNPDPAEPNAPRPRPEHPAVCRDDEGKVECVCGLGDELGEAF